MLDKKKIYYFIENITPPFVFKILKANFLYKYVKDFFTKFSKQRIPEIVTIQKGTLSGAKLFLCPEGNWQKEMMNDTYDSELFDYVQKKNWEGKVIYDIGAHIGYHSLKFSELVGASGSVYAFEPNKVNVERFEKILSINSPTFENVRIFDVALSDKEGTTDFFSTENIEGGTSTGGFVDEADTLWTRDTYINKTGFLSSKVEIKTLDKLIDSKEILKPDLLKIDVEGAEQLVLSGFLKHLPESQPIILIEFHSIYSAYSCMKILTKHNYKTTLLKKESDGRVMIVAEPLKN